MANEQTSPRDVKQSTVYQIRIKGHLSQQRIDWFEGMAVTLEENGETVLRGAVVDQPALHGILKKIRDLGVPLLAVYQVEPKHVEMKTSTNSVKPKRSKRRKK